MNKVSKSDMQQLSSLAGEINDLFNEIETVTDEMQVKLAGLVEQVNDKRQEAAEIMDQAAAEAENYYDEKSDKWQEGDRGSAYGEWRDTLRGVADQLGEDIDTPGVPSLDRPDWLAEIEEQSWAEFEF